MDQVGKVRALTTLSPVRTERLRQLRRRLRFVRYTPGLGRPLEAMGIIHYARWCLVDALPGPKGGWRGLHSTYLLFESNYVGTDVDDYLDTFSNVVPERLAAVWSACVGFEERVLRAPGAPSLVIPPRAFRGFIGENRLRVVDFHAAYPEFTAAEVRQAIALRERAEALFEGDPDEQAVAERRNDLLQMAVGPASPPLPLRQRARELYAPWRRAVRGRYGVTPLAVALPLRDAAAQPLSFPGFLERLLGDTQAHFARVSVVPPWLTDVGQRHPDRLETAYLLVSADFWGGRYAFLEQVRERLRPVWSRAASVIDGFPKAGDELAFHAWIERHSIRTSYYVAGYPPRSVGEIRRLVEARRADAARIAERGRAADRAGVAAELDRA